MIYGIGNDVVEVSRIKKALENPKFKERVYTESEVDLIELKGGKWESYAGRFAAKEAIAKAFGTGVRDFNFSDIEILNDTFGKPMVTLKNGLENMYVGFKIEMSISHSKEYATAVAIIFKENQN